MLCWGLLCQSLQPAETSAAVLLHVIWCCAVLGVLCIDMLAAKIGACDQVSTGALRVRWADAHDGARITAMAFDLNFRRLITGCDTGALKVLTYRSVAICTYCYSAVNS